MILYFFLFGGCACEIVFFVVFQMCLRTHTHTHKQKCILLYIWNIMCLEFWVRMLRARMFYQKRILYAGLYLRDLRHIFMYIHTHICVRVYYFIRVELVFFFFSCASVVLGIIIITLWASLRLYI